MLSDLIGVMKLRSEDSEAWAHSLSKEEININIETQKCTELPVGCRNVLEIIHGIAAVSPFLILLFQVFILTFVSNICC